MMNFRSTSKWLKMTSFQSRSMSDPHHSDIDFKNKMALFRTTLNEFSLFTVFGDSNTEFQEFGN